jgi:putative glutamine amidotransferase
MADGPLIGISMSVTVGGKRPERAYLNTAYLVAVQRAGGLPLALPPQLDQRAQRALFRRVDGVLLTGGGDVDPARFNEAPHPTTSEISQARDGLEIALVEHALDRRVPLLALCRGIQVLNVALGGTLHQDVGSDPGTPIQHSQTAPRHELTHAVKVVPGSRLEGVLGVDQLHVNSFHHQAIKSLGRGLVAVAFAEDGLIEGAELEDPSRFVLGVQWHPEELATEHETARRLFEALVERARRHPRS